MFKVSVAAVAAFVALFAITARAAELAPLSAYGRLPGIEGVDISPDGKLLAITVTDGERRLLAVRKTDTTALVTGINMDAVKVRSVQWAGPEHLLVITSSTADVYGLRGPAQEYFQAIDFNIVTGKQTQLLKGQVDSMNVVIGAPMVRIVHGVPFVYLEGVHFVDNTGWDTLYRVNLKTGITTMLDHGGNENTDGWLVDDDGAAIAQSLYDQKKGLWSLKLRINKAWKTVDQTSAPMGSYGISGFGRDGKSVLVWKRDAEANTILREYSLDGTHLDLPKGVEMDGLVHDPGNLGLLGGVSLVGDDLRYTFFDPKSQATWNAVVKAFQGERVSLASWSEDRRKVVVMVDSPAEGAAYALVDLDAKNARYVGEVYRSLKPEHISPVRSISYKAKDGLTISGYLTLPQGRDPKKLPLVVLPHGGPEGRDAPGFDWWSQALASHGYAVLQPNFRGSEGFGWDFVKAGFGQWGKAMQTDLSDGVRDLAAQGLIDPKRVCIVGASYGGYAALAGATLDKGVYRCAASVAGPSDLKRMLIDNQRRYMTNSNSALRYWLRFMGADGLKDPDLAAISPAKLADAVEIPILLIHGKDDTVVPYVQSQIMASALKKAGKPVELVTLEGEDHWLSSGATRLIMLTSTVDFLQKHNPPN
ncbi:alpha/beta hydrolase family protein [Caulobacter sp. DWR1-3-2b1]|uniref:alpha/beta hydrolase family protein n=1 Tax=Caulobacter sp. DWR1-3-2b1 TaxID=2804670 RepID=UPI003CEDFC77